MTGRGPGDALLQGKKRSRYPISEWEGNSRPRRQRISSRNGKVALVEQLSLARLSHCGSRAVRAGWLAESETNFRMRNADATIRHALEPHRDTTARLKNPSSNPSPFSPLHRRREGHSDARTDPVLPFLYFFPHAFFFLRSADCSDQAVVCRVVSANLKFFLFHRRSPFVTHV